VGDRVTATGTVTYASKHDAVCDVHIDGEDGTRHSFAAAALTLIEPAEPPVGSVVVKDGVAWSRGKANGDEPWWSPTRSVGWSEISDGEVIFTPGGDA